MTTTTMQNNLESFARAKKRSKSFERVFFWISNFFDASSFQLQDDVKERTEPKVKDEKIISIVQVSLIIGVMCSLDYV